MLDERIELMYESGQVDQDTYERTPALLRQVESKLAIQLSEENGGSFTSHLMKAIERVKTNQAVASCSDALLAQATSNLPLFTFSIELLAPFNTHQADLEAEAAFIASYLLGMTEEEETV
ncbi:hypothetical protein ACX1C1_08020 [Paenibacillus sp. strain BS8-2]